MSRANQSVIYTDEPMLLVPPKQLRTAEAWTLPLKMPCGTWRQDVCS